MSREPSPTPTGKRSRGTSPSAIDNAARLAAGIAADNPMHAQRQLYSSHTGTCSKDGGWKGPLSVPQ